MLPRVVDVGHAARLILSFSPRAKLVPRTHHDRRITLRNTNSNYGEFLQKVVRSTRDDTVL